MENKVSFLKYILTCAIGFGIGGAVWGGWGLYQDFSIKYPLTALGAIILGITGSLSFSILSQNIKQGFKIFFLGFLGTILGFFFAGIGVYNLPNIFINYFLSLILPNILPENLNDLFNLISKVGGVSLLIYTLNFILAGAFIGLFYAFALKIKIWPMVWRGAVGFGLAAIISPVIGNIIGNVLNSLFVSYVLTFALIGVILGKFLGWGVYKSNFKL